MAETKSVMVPDPVSKAKPPKAYKPTPKDIKDLYGTSKSVPVDDPVDNPAKSASAPVLKAQGGTASSRADGIAQRGKTRGTMIMCGGGYAKGKK
jgi:hypothetical protein